MHRVLLTAAAITALVGASPAIAQYSSTTAFGAMSRSQPIEELRGRPGTPGQFGGSDRRHFHGGDGSAAGSGYAAYTDYYGDFDANRSFDPGKWNDWWHDRPDRAFPRWVWSNQGCTADRMWYSGSGWRCTP